jgi:hypothetical protein
VSDSCTISIKTVPPYEITDITAKSGGFNIFSTHEVTDKGIVWGTVSTPTTALPTKTSDGAQGLPFDSDITGLTVDTVYYVRAYAISSCGTFYGDTWSFKTSASAVGNLNQCYEEVITIEPNETYVIPANSQVISITNAGSLESDCFVYNG